MNPDQFETPKIEKGVPFPEGFTPPSNYRKPEYPYGNLKVGCSLSVSKREISGRQLWARAYTWAKKHGAERRFSVKTSGGFVTLTRIA